MIDVTPAPGPRRGLPYTLYLAGADGGPPALQEHHRRAGRELPAGLRSGGAVQQLRAGGRSRRPLGIHQLRRTQLLPPEAQLEEILLRFDVHVLKVT